MAAYFTSVWQAVPAAEVTFTPVQGPNDDVTFDQEPVNCSCPYCNEKRVSEVVYKSSWFSYIACVLVLLLVGKIGIILLPFLWPIFKDTVHRCPTCRNILARRKRIGFPKVTKEVVSIRVGNCAIVLSRVYVIVLCVMVGIVLFFSMMRWVRWDVLSKDYLKGEEITDTWDEFQEKCNFKYQLGNPIQSRNNFDKHYKGKTVKWVGRVDQIYESHSGQTWLMVDMAKYRILNKNPDLALLTEESQEEFIAALSPGDKMEFSATLLEFSRRKQPILAVVWSFNVMEKAADSVQPTMMQIADMLLPISLQGETIQEPASLPKLNSSPKESALNSDDSNGEKQIVSQKTVTNE